MTLEPGDHVWYWNGQVSQELGIPQAAWFRGFQGPTDYLGHGRRSSSSSSTSPRSSATTAHAQLPGHLAWLNNCEWLGPVT